MEEIINMIIALWLVERTLMIGLSLIYFTHLEKTHQSLYSRWLIDVSITLYEVFSVSL